MEGETGMNDMIPMCLIIQGEMFFFKSTLTQQIRNTSNYIQAIMNQRHPTTDL